MPYNPNANWTALTALQSRQPVYLVRFDGLASKQYSTGQVRAPSRTTLPIMRVPDSIGQKLSQLQGRQTLTTFRLQLVDAGGEVTTLVATEAPAAPLPTLLNREVRLYVGYATLDESDYALIAIAEVSDVELDDDRGSYTFSLVDIRRRQNDDIFTNADASGTQPINTRLAADANAGTFTLTLLNVADITAGTAERAGTMLFLGPSTDATDAGAEEKVEVVGINGQVVTVRDPLVSSYDAGDDVRWATSIIEGNPINLIYAILTGDFANATFPLTEVRGLPTGLGLAAGDLDQASLLLERNLFLTDDTLRFEIRDPERGFGFLESKIYRLYGFPVLMGDGKLSFRCYRPPFADVATAGLPQITEADILDWGWERDHSLHVNRVTIGVDVEPETGDPAQEIVVEDTADQTATKEMAEFEALDTGLRATLRGERLAEERGAHLLRRFKVVPPILRLILPMNRRALLNGEVAEITHARIPNAKTGTRGLSGLRMEIIERTERMSLARIELRLQDANYVRPFAWAPDSYTFDYDSATAAQKEYAAWAPDAGNFADGGSPYEWV